MQHQPVSTLAGLHPLPRLSKYRFVTPGKTQSCCRINQENLGAGKSSQRVEHPERLCCTHIYLVASGSVGASLPFPKLLPKSQPKEPNRLFLVCSAKSQREKQGSKSGAHDSITSYALFPGHLPSHLQELDIPNFSGQRLSLMTCTFFRCPSSRGS